MLNILLNIATSDGGVQSCNVTYSTRPVVALNVSSSVFGELRFEAGSLFELLIQFRLHLEATGCLLLCNAARKDTYPSRLMKQMGGGFKTYVLHMGQQTRRLDAIDALAPATLEQVTTVAEQRIAYKDWLKSLGWTEVMLQGML